MRRISLSAAGCLATALLATSEFGIHAQQRPAAASATATCDPARIDGESYRLTTEAQAFNVLRPREPWWEPYGLWNGPREIGEPNEAATKLAERARELDDTNLLAHGQLARHYVIMAIDARQADDAWKRVLDGGGAVVWTGTLYELDARSLFIFAFDRKSIRIYRFGQLAGEVKTHFGVPKFPGAQRVDFWRALGGCLPADVPPEAEIPWSDVTEIGGDNWTLRFDLTREVTVASDRGKRRHDDSIEVALHGRSGFVDYRFGMTAYGPWPPYHRPPGPDPVLYQERVRHMLVKWFDPEGRIKLPKLGRW